ncbi:MAG: glycosyltransferase family 2 protein [Acidimicrobiales bacterium]|jgi:N-acetylglucosaminyl-diphospho-decaprenol L-rhamnosyltransferase
MTPCSFADTSTADTSTRAASVGAVVVNHNAGESLLKCVASLRAEGVAELVVVDNASSDGSPDALAKADPEVQILRTGVNLGYGAGANRGLASVRSEMVLVSNPDVAVHSGAIGALEKALAADATIAIAGPRVEEPDGTRYPSARRFPSFVDAVGHVVLGQLVPGNRFTDRYRMEDLDLSEPTEVDWVSGACLFARRRALCELGGFDEAYFMYAEDVDLSWRARQAGWGVSYVPEAVVTHSQGLSTSQHPYRMLVAHHRSAYRFASRSTRGWRRAALPGAAGLLGVHLAAACVKQAVRRRASEKGGSAGKR